MKPFQRFFTGAVIATFIFSCSHVRAQLPANLYTSNVQFAAHQYANMLDTIHARHKILLPRTMDKMSRVVYVGIEDWCSGFFPGSLWYLYRLTNDEKWKHEAEQFTQTLDSVKHLRWHHDVGFMIGCSYLNGWRVAPSKAYEAVIVEAARSLATRFRPHAQVIQSWDVNSGWQARRGWKCPVIIDNMMNLELLFEATRLSGDSLFHKIAVAHANTTLAHHFRNNGSCYHVVDYDPETGQVRSRQTAQGYADESVWARGQAWAIYGYTLCYRYTHNKAYLDRAVSTLRFILNHPNLPADQVPYWDYLAPNIPHEPRDASSAACLASALFEMHQYLPSHGYARLGTKLLQALSGKNYRAPQNKNGNFILMHSVGSIPHNSEIDVPLNYADYYFLEALARYQQLPGLGYTPTVSNSTVRNHPQR